MPEPDEVIRYDVDSPVVVGEVGATFGESVTSAAIAAAPAPDAAGPTPPSDTDSAQFLRGCLRGVLLVVFGAFFGMTCALLTLFALNGTLRFDQSASVILLKSDVESLDSDLSQLRTQTEQGLTDANAGIASAAQAAEAAAADAQANKDSIATLGEQANALRDQSSALQSRLDDMEAELASLTEQAAAFSAAAERFDAFVDGLRQALTAALILTPEAAGTATPTPATTGLSPFAGPEPGTALEMFPPTDAFSPPASGRGHLFGVVWNDLNRNGEPDAGERPLRGVIIVLSDSAGETLARTLSGIDGRYLFPDLDPGTYIVEQEDGLNFTSTSPNRVILTLSAGELAEANFADAPK